MKKVRALIKKLSNPLHFDNSAGTITIAEGTEGVFNIYHNLIGNPPASEFNADMITATAPKWALADQISKRLVGGVAVAETATVLTPPQLKAFLKENNIEVA